MPSLKEIKRRIKSVKSTQKITQAMYMISTTKLKKADSRVNNARPFSEELLDVFRSLLAHKNSICMSSIKTEKAIENYPALMQVRDVKTVGILVVSSNKGLSGPYNTNVVRATLERIEYYKKQGIDVILGILGQRAYNALKRSPNAEIVNYFTNLSEDVSAGETSVIAEGVAKFFVEGQADKIEIITTEFKSKISNSPVVWPLLPLELPEEETEEANRGPAPEMIFEPSPEAVLPKVVPLYIANRIYQARLEAYASELASRMTAMKAATDNADEMIGSLTVTYNKARQASITQEILEVVSGAEALQ